MKRYKQLITKLAYNASPFTTKTLHGRKPYMRRLHEAATSVALYEWANQYSVDDLRQVLPPRWSSQPTVHFRQITTSTPRRKKRPRRPRETLVSEMTDRWYNWRTDDDLRRVLCPSSRRRPTE